MTASDYDIVSDTSKARRFGFRSAWIRRRCSCARSLSSDAAGSSRDPQRSRYFPFPASLLLFGVAAEPGLAGVKTEAAGGGVVVAGRVVGSCCVGGAAVGLAAAAAALTGALRTSTHAASTPIAVVPLFLEVELCMISCSSSG